jgi:hypothetical protein
MSYESTTSDPGAEPPMSMPMHAEPPTWCGLALDAQKHASLVAWLAAHTHEEAVHAMRMGIDLYAMQHAQVVQSLVTREIQGQAAQLFQGALLEDTQVRLQSQLAPVAGKLDQLQATLGQMHNNLQVSSLKGAVGENLARGQTEGTNSHALASATRFSPSTPPDMCSAASSSPELLTCFPNAC